MDALEGTRLDTETAELDGFYASVRRSVAGITDAAGKQTTIKRLYEKFFTTAFSSTSDRLGIVYTPNEIVDFLLHSADAVLRKEFGATLSDEGVHVLDPFTGTGTFIVRLLQSGLIKPADLQRKFRYELHANELVLLAYYVAAVNIEATYHDLVQGTGYEPFPGIVLTDTFQSAENDDMDDAAGVFEDNNERVVAQNALDIRVIVGNPPYSAGQDSANDNNQNLKYRYLDAGIAATYAAKSTAQNKNGLYDSYIRAIRWASDRIKDRGVVAFVSNGGYLDGNTADGLRKSLTAEFSSLYILNLRGNGRTSGEQRRKEKDGVFGEGSRATVAIAILVKNPDATTHGPLRYRDIGDYLTREQKLTLLTQYGDITGVPWETLHPNAEGDWINQRNTTFASFTPIGDKAHPATAVFRSYSAGLQTNRDAWVYNSSRPALEHNVSRMIDTYNSEVERWKASDKSVEIADFVEKDATKISWARSLRGALAKGTTLDFDSSLVATSTYRPFNKQSVYFAPLLNHERSQMPKMFPTVAHKNVGFFGISPGETVSFSVVMTDQIPDLHLIATGQFFPRYTYEARPTQAALFGDEDDFVRVDNITDEILADYRRRYGANVSKDDVFFFVYGLLHSPDYRASYAADLKKMLPRIPTLADPTDFAAFSAAGRALSELHLGYEVVEPYPLTITSSAPGDPDYRVTKMRFGGKAGAWDRSTIRFNDSTTITGIPPEAQEYLLGSRSAIEWIIERYQMKVDGPSGIRNDPNDWATEHDDPAYILTLLQRIVTVSMETVRIVNSLPPLRIARP